MHMDYIFVQMMQTAGISRLDEDLAMCKYKLKEDFSICKNRLEEDLCMNKSEDLDVYRLYICI